MRSPSVAPAAPQRQLAYEIDPPEGNENETTRAFALECPHDPLDDRDASVFADGSEAVSNAAAPAPTRETLGGELNAPVGDDVSIVGQSPFRVRTR